MTVPFCVIGGTPLTIMPGLDDLGDTLSLTDGYTQLTITTEVGPRIIELKPATPNGFNMMYFDKYDKVKKDGPELFGDICEDPVWHLYGGHRTWVGPETDHSYYPDNLPIHTVFVQDNCLTFGPKLMPGYHSIYTKIFFCGKKGLLVKTSIDPTAKKIEEKSVWSIHALKPGGKLTMPYSEKGDRVTYWPYTDKDDPRIILGDKCITVDSSIKYPKPLKIGTYAENPELRYTLKENGVEQTLRVMYYGENELPYSDRGCNAEVYCVDDYIELESLSPSIRTDSGKEISFIQRWVVQ